MDAPPIQYARTSDGVNIAYWIMGHGEPLIHDMLPAASHLELEWKLTSLRSWYERLFERFTVVRFDHRGRGLSDRDLSDLSLDAHMRDVDAVADAARLDTFVLLGTRHMGPVSIAYSVANPGRVSHLALLNTWASGAKPSVLTALEASRSLSKLDHGIWAENIARFVAGRRDPDPALLDLFQGSVDPGSPPTMLEAFAQFDVTSQLTNVNVPCLVLHQSDDRTHPADLARTLAAGIPRATLIGLETAGDPYLTGKECDRLLEILSAFVGVVATTPSAVVADGAFRTILFTDVEASTALTDRFGDARARGLLREHERLTRDALANHGGTEIKTMGDGFMASFTSASSALDAAIAMQRAMAEHYADSVTPIRIRVGINAGEPIEEQNDLYGASVIRAARVMGQAQGGEILVSNVVRELVEGKEYLFSDRGEADLKGFDEAVRLFEVRWGANASPTGSGAP